MKINSSRIQAAAGLFLLTGTRHLQAASGEVVEPTVSINGLMVTLVDHAAHYLWDYGALNREITEQEWRGIEFNAIKLAGAGPLITLGGTGEMDEEWVASPQWSAFSRAMRDAAMMALEAAETRNQEALMAAGDALVQSCEGCHEAFKPASPTEGIVHQPSYDHLYHLFVE